MDPLSLFLKKHQIQIDREMDILLVGIDLEKDHSEEGFFLMRELFNNGYSVVGTDLSAEGVKKWEDRLPVTCDDIENTKIQKKFDLIIFEDVIEHVNNVGKAFNNLIKLLKDNGTCLITTPNAGFLGDLIRLHLTVSPSIFQDHVATFHSAHLSNLCRRNGLDNYSIHFYNSKPYYGLTSLLKYYALEIITMLNRRYASHIGCKIKI